MNARVLDKILPLTTVASPLVGRELSPGPHREHLVEGLLRLKDELFWPRILVRCAPPQDGI